MCPPSGYGELSGKVVQVFKCQHGLKEAGREWYILQVNWLVNKIGLEQCKVPLLMIKNEVPLMLVVHLDDITVCGEKDVCNKILQLKKRLPLKN